MTKIKIRCRGCKTSWVPDTWQEMYLCPDCGRRVNTNPKAEGFITL